MTDIFREIDDEVRRAKAAAVWNRYRNVFAVVAVVAVAGVGGWQFWQHQERQTASGLGSRFESALRASSDGNATEAEAMLTELAGAGKGGYARLARFRLAAEVGRRDAAAGAAAFEALAADTTLDQSYRDLARLRAGLLRVDIAPYAELKTTLEPLTTGTNSWRHTARELLGISAMKASQYDDAGRWFDAIVTDPQAPQALRQRVELYLALVRGGAVETKN
jgi:hypothetical protein